MRTRQKVAYIALAVLLGLMAIIAVGVATVDGGSESTMCTTTDTTVGSVTHCY